MTTTTSTINSNPTTTTTTVVAVKKAFVAAQIRLLSQPLEPSAAWQRTNESEAIRGGGLQQDAAEAAVRRLDQLLRRHCRRAYPPRASAHVAEQIDRLYWQAAEPANPAPGLGAVPLLGADLADADVVANLPPTWPIATARQQQPTEADQYAEAAARLTALVERRARTAARVARLQRLRAAATPLAAYDAVQRNLATRDGPVERELERARLLLARVGGRLQQCRRTATDTDPVVCTLRMQDTAGIDAALIAAVEKSKQQINLPPP